MLGKVDAPRQHEGGGREQGVGSSARYRGSKTGVVEGRQPLRMGLMRPMHMSPMTAPRSLNQVRADTVVDVQQVPVSVAVLAGCRDAIGDR
jgi:hypothetical protein